MRRYSGTLADLDSFTALKNKKIDMIKHLEQGLWRDHTEPTGFAKLEYMHIRRIRHMMNRSRKFIRYEKNQELRDLEERIFNFIMSEDYKRSILIEKTINKTNKIQYKPMENKTTHDTPAITGTPAIEAPADPKNAKKPQTEESKAAKMLANKRARYKNAIKTGVKAYLYADDFKLKAVIFTVVAREKHSMGYDILLHTRYRIVKDETKLYKPSLKDDIYSDQQVKDMIASDDILSKSNSEEYSADKIADLMIRAEEYIASKEQKATEKNSDAPKTNNVRRTDQYIFEGEKWGPYEVTDVTPSYSKGIRLNPLTGKDEVFSTDKIIGYKVEARIDGKTIEMSQSAYASCISKYGYKKPDVQVKEQQLFMPSVMSETNNKNILVGKTEISNTDKTEATKIEEIKEKLNGLIELVQRFGKATEA